MTTTEWGPHTWNMFHTLAEKIKDEYFCETKLEFWNMIKNICGNLPCPYCAQHANEFMSKIKTDNIKSKDDIIKILFVFHNSVNERLEKPKFDATKLREQYSNNNTIQVFNIFMNRYRIASNRGMQFHKSLQSRHVLSQFVNWFQQNNYKFNM
tara:strand:- start:1638 stop:2096 length:459 start_codon:yes stop_codon:yes gene_type:complete